MKKSANKERIYNTTLKSKNIDKGDIIALLDTDCLDNIINRITKDKTILNSNSIIKKGYLTGEEQFIDLLSNFIYYFRMMLPTIVHNNMCIYNIFKNQVPTILLNKDYYHDNKNEEYNKEFKKLIVRNMYDNIKILYPNFSNKVWKKFKISDNMDIGNDKDVDTLFNFMRLLTWSNINEYAILYLFDNLTFAIYDMMKKRKIGYDEALNSIGKHYYIQYEIMIDNCLKKYKLIEKLISNID